MATEYRMSNPSWGREAVLAKVRGCRCNYWQDEFRKAVLSSVRFITVNEMRKNGTPCDYIWSGAIVPGCGEVISERPLSDKDFESCLNKAVRAVSELRAGCEENAQLLRERVEEWATVSP